MKTRDAFGKVLQTERLKQALTLRDLSGMAFVSISYLSEIEHGQKEASSEYLASILGSLKMTLPDFLEEVARLLRSDAGA